MGFMRLTEDHELIPVLSHQEWVERDAELRRLWTLKENWRGDGIEPLTRAEIGRRLGVTENAIIGRLNRIGLPRREKSPSQPGSPRHGEFMRRKAKRRADALLKEQEEQMARINANPVREPRIIARIQEYIARGWPPGKPGNKDIAALLLREFQISVTDGQIAGALRREGIDRGGYKREGNGGAVGLERVKARTLSPLPSTMPNHQPITRPANNVPAMVARASGNPSPFDNLAHRAPLTAPTPMPYRRAQECCWPIGEPGTPKFRYCDAPHKNRTYCDYHAAMAFVRVRDRRDDHAAVDNR